MRIVTKGLYRGPHPTYLDLRTIKEIGIKNIVNLEPNWFSLWNEILELEDTGIEVHSFPLCPILPPSMQMVRYLVKLIEELMRIGPVYVHCKAGVDRTGYIVGAYRVMVEKRNIESAMNEMDANGMHWWLRWWKVSFHRDFGG